MLYSSRRLLYASLIHPIQTHIVIVSGAHMSCAEQRVILYSVLYSYCSDLMCV